MALIHSMEKNGNFLFRYRGQFPIILFLLAVPVIYFTDYSFMSPTLYWILTGIAIFLSVLGFVIRAIAIGTSKKNTSGRNTEEQVAEALNTTGIYSTVRHPLYLGNYFMWIGIVFYSFNIWFILLTSLFFWIYYERIMFAEERFLEKKFGQEYVDWSMKVPPFWPSRKNHIKNEIPFSIKTIMRREYSGVTATILGFLFVDICRHFFLLGTDFKWTLNFTIITVAALLTSLIFRSLKHYTKLLHEEDRS